MPNNLIDPLLWQTIPFEDPDAWEDFLGMHQLWHETLAKVTETSWQPLDIRATGGPATEQSKIKLQRASLMANQQMHHDIADSLGINRSGDLVSYDLTNRDQFIGWLWVHSLDHARLRTAAGI